MWRSFAFTAFIEMFGDDREGSRFRMRPYRDLRMSGLLPLLFALAIAETSYHDGFHGPGVRTWAIILGGSFVAWIILCEIMIRALARLRNRKWMERWDVASQALVLGWFAWICYGLHWTCDVKAYTPGIFPWMAMQAANWWCTAVGVRALGGQSWGRASMLMHQIRFSMLPMAVVLPLFDVCNAITVHTGIQDWFIDHVGLNATMVAGSLGLGFAVVGVLPAALVYMWRAEPLAAGPTADWLYAACARMGVGVRSINIWKVPGGRVYNAAVLGVIPRIRYVLFTEDLLRDFEPPLVEAVLGHELGHARHRHLLVYLVFALVTLLASFLLAAPVAHVIAKIPGVRQMPVTVQLGMATMALLALKWRLIFGYLSRACERQADLAGAELVADPAIMQQALREVARRSGQSEHAPSWRHFTIAQRIAFLQRVRENPAVAVRHHRLVAWWRAGLIAMVLVLAAFLGIINMRDGATNPFLGQLFRPHILATQNSHA